MSSGLFGDHLDHEQIIKTNQFNSVSVGKSMKIETKTVEQRNKEKFYKKKKHEIKPQKKNVFLIINYSSKEIKSINLIDFRFVLRIKLIRKEIDQEMNEYKTARKPKE